MYSPYIDDLSLIKHASLGFYLSTVMIEISFTWWAIDNKFFVISKANSPFDFFQVVINSSFRKRDRILANLQFLFLFHHFLILQLKWINDFSLFCTTRLFTFLIINQYLLIIFLVYNVLLYSYICILSTLTPIQIMTV